MAADPMDLVDKAIADIEARLGLLPGQSIDTNKNNNKKQNNNKKNAKKQQSKPGAPPPDQQPDICKLEFKVGVITKVWNHPEADKLYCEEIDVGEESVRQIASGLRPYMTTDDMLGARLLVVSNLKAKNLVRFKSHGMVLCCKETSEDGTERCEFVQPPEGALIGEVVTFEGLPKPHPLSGAQVEKKKVWVTCAQNMKSNGSCVATWNGHAFMTSAGPCKTKTIKNAQLS
ncbi:unnamed protein product [Cylindrotheca closterium]|uniref:tRNA-binding domain-containing protein n=1 Tax=Cylindrotheca closterium TaxID=2856 RepID=A0AAD2CL15_9STRA|nr:unnamed protein product [Cylindrotheca closterium]